MLPFSGAVSLPDFASSEISPGPSEVPACGTAVVLAGTFVNLQRTRDATGRKEAVLPACSFTAVRRE